MIKEGFQVLKRDINELDENNTYDLICFKDSLEHVFKPVESLKKASKLLKPNGKIMITIPLKNGIMWDIYKEYSFVLCPPTHIIIPSIEGVEKISDLCDLKIKELTCDSNEFLVLMSEDKINFKKQFAEDSYSKYIHSLNPIRKLYNLYIKKFNTRLFPDSNLTMYQIQKKVFELNEKNETDHGIFILEKIDAN